MINVNEIAKIVLTEIQKLEVESQGNLHYCRGAKDGVQRMVEDIAKAIEAQNKPTPAEAEAKPIARAKRKK